ncbi:protein of unknown function [Streptomyces murinus]
MVATTVLSGFSAGEVCAMLRWRASSLWIRGDRHVYGDPLSWTGGSPPAIAPPGEPTPPQPSPSSPDGTPHRHAPSARPPGPSSRRPTTDSSAGPSPT